MNRNFGPTGLMGAAGSGRLSRPDALPVAPGPRGRLLIAAILLCGLATHARAVEFLVDQGADEPDLVPGDGTCATASGGCSLRAAVQEANRTPGHDTIVLAAGQHWVTIDPVDDDSAEESGDVDVLDALTIRGAGPAREDCTVQGDGGSGLIQAEDALLEVSDCRFLGAGVEASAIRAQRQPLTIRNCEFRGNESGWAGAVLAARSLVLEDSIFVDNVGIAVLLDSVVTEGEWIVVEGLFVRRCRIEGSGRGVVAISDQAFEGTDRVPVVISDTEFLDNEFLSTNLVSWWRGVLVERCRFTGTGPLRIHETLDATIADSHFVDAPGRAVEFTTGGLGGDDRIRIERCSFRDGGDTAFVFVRGRVSVENCTFLRQDQAVYQEFSSHPRPEDWFRMRSCTIVGNGRTPDDSTAVDVFYSTAGASPFVQNCYFQDSGRGGAWSGRLSSGGYNKFDSLGEAADGEPAPSDSVSASWPIETVVDPVHGARVLLAPGNRGIDAGHPAGCAREDGGLLATDQAWAPRHLDGDGDGLARCDIGATESCGPDSDGDGHGDACDCAPNDPGAWAGAPQLLVSALRWLPEDGVWLEWEAVEAPGVSVGSYEVGRGTLAALHADREARTSCVANGPGRIWGDPAPPAGSLFYLVRGVSDCSGPGQAWGRDSLGGARPGCP